MEAVAIRKTETRAEIRSTAVSARIRHQRLEGQKNAEIIALDVRRGYALGLLWLDNRITEEQHNAGLKYTKDMARYYGLTGHQQPSPRAQNLFSQRDDGDESEGRIEAAKKARERKAKLDELLLAVGDINTARRVKHAVTEVTVLDNQFARGWPEPMMFLVRRGLNALHKFYVEGA